MILIKHLPWYMKIFSQQENLLLFLVAFSNNNKIETIRI